MKIEETKSLVKQVVENYFKYLKEGNTTEIIKLYAENAEVIPHGSPSYGGKNNIEQSYERGFKSIKLHGDVSFKSVDIFDDVTIVRCEEPAQIESLKNETIVNAYFRELFVLVKNMNTGNWEIFKYMFSQNPNQVKNND